MSFLLPILGNVLGSFLPKIFGHGVYVGEDGAPLVHREISLHKNHIHHHVIEGLSGKKHTIKHHHSTIMHHINHPAFIHHAVKMHGEGIFDAASSLVGTLVRRYGPGLIKSGAEHLINHINQSGKGMNKWDEYEHTHKGMFKSPSKSHEWEDMEAKEYHMIGRGTSKGAHRNPWLKFVEDNRMPGETLEDLSKKYKMTKKSKMLGSGLITEDDDEPVMQMMGSGIPSYGRGAPSSEYDILV